MLKDKIVTINNNKENIRIANSVWHKILPFVLIISFMWLGFYQALLAFNAYPLELLTGSISSSFILEIVLTGLIYYIGFEILFWVYRFAIGFSLYSFVVPSQAVKDGLRWWIIVRNLIMGGLYFLCIWLPYIYSYLAIVDLLCLFFVFVMFTLTQLKKYAEPMIYPFVYKSLMLPFIIYEFLNATVQVVGYLLWKSF